MGPNLKEFQIRIVAKKEFHSAVQFSAEPCWTRQCRAPDVHTAINTASPILRPCPPILCRCLTGQLPISWMVSTNMFFPWWPLGWVCFQRWRGRRSWSERTGDQELPPQRSLYFPQTFVGTGDAPSSSWSPFFQGTVPWEPMGWLGGDRLQRSNLLEWHLGSKERDVAGWESCICNGHMSLGGSFHIRSQPSFPHVGHGSVPYDRLARTLVGSV